MPSRYFDHPFMFFFTKPSKQFFRPISFFFYQAFGPYPLSSLTKSFNQPISLFAGCDKIKKCRVKKREEEEDEEEGEETYLVQGIVEWSSPAPVLLGSRDLAL